MLKKIFLTALLCLVAMTAWAEDFGEFSIDMSGDWQKAADPIRQQGVVMVVMMSPSDGSAINVTMAPSQGMNAKALSAGAAEGFKAQGTDIKVVSESDDKVVFEGTQSGMAIRMVMSTAGNDMATVVLTGDLAKADTVAKTIKFKNSKLQAR